LPIILLAIVVRFWHLGIEPPGVLVDEASLGYNAYSVLISEHDEWGNKYPLILKSFDDFKPAGYIYIALPLVKIFGLNSYSIRLPSALFGVVAVFFLFVIVIKLTQDINLALISSFILAITPWHVYMSRMAWEANVSLSLFLVGLSLAISGFNDKKRIILSSLSFSLSLYVYVGYQILTPLLLIFFLFFFYHKKSFPKDKLILFIVVFLILIFPIIIGILFKGGAARFNQVSILKQAGNTMYIDEQRTFCAMQNSNILTFLCYLIWNKPVVVTLVYLKQYISSLSPDFLFLSGDTASFVNNPEHGGLFFWLLPCFFGGLFVLFCNLKKTSNQLIILWLLLSPIMAAIAGKPHFVRSNMVMIPVVIVSSVGLIVSIEMMRNRFNVTRKILVFVIISLSLMNVFTTMVDYFFIYTKKAMAWEEQYKPMYNFLSIVEKNYKVIFIHKLNRHPYIYHIFYQAVDPNYFINNVERKDNEVLSLGKYRYVDDDLDNIYCLWQKTGRKKTLYITDGRRSNSIPLFSIKSFNKVHTLISIYDLERVEKDFIGINKITKCEAK